VLCYAVARKIPIKGVTTFQPCPADKPLLAAFIAEAKGQPAVATVLDHSGEQPVTISRKSFYRATGGVWTAFDAVRYTKGSSGCQDVGNTTIEHPNQLHVLRRGYQQCLAC
jgi:hypothetical protein